MPTPVLLITHDDLLWQHWRELDAARWLPARGRTLADLERWREQRRTLVVLDADLPRLPHWKASSWPALMSGLQVIVASANPNDDQGTLALGAGAQGYCHSYKPVRALAQVLEFVSSGETWMGRSLVRRLLQLVSERGQPSSNWTQGLLTEREAAVAHRAAYGQANAEIGEALGITERTVKAHMSAVFEKLGVSDRLQLALLVHGVSQPQAAHAK